MSDDLRACTTDCVATSASTGFSIPGVNCSNNSSSLVQFVSIILTHRCDLFQHSFHPRVICGNIPSQNTIPESQKNLIFKGGILALRAHCTHTARYF